ncbi:ELWxxDGT repeat-containing protein [Pseudidiomarina maritima]|uniref:ELWxxDGT repeat-containing protein n=1 Tax=Pseudidiomarina maritima TaxID=519453 RepID=A0A1I6H8R0_9GAMM|nr:putative Ig domain-containing protein [Pseudidiomarina maritima]SFR50687.1 ELWxxDGT repeat-containing protein [Pseudidiomarina maritima]
MKFATSVRCAAAFLFLFFLFPAASFAAKVEVVADLNASTTLAGQSPYYMTELNGKIYYRGYDQYYGYELWEYDPATDTRRMVMDYCPRNCSLQPDFLITLGDRIYFRGIRYTESGGYWQLYYYDSVNDEITLASSLPSGSTTQVIEFNGKIYFGGYNTNQNGQRLYEFDPASGTTQLIYEFSVDSVGVNIVRLAKNDTSLFIQYYLNGTPKLSQFNPEASEEVPISLVFNGESATGFGDIVANNSFIYMAAQYSSYGNELLIINLNDNSTNLNDIHSGAGSSSPYGLSLIGSDLYFSAYNAMSGASETFVQQGGSATMVELSVASTNPNPYGYTSYNGSVYYRAYSNEHGYEMHRINPSNLTSSLAVDIYPGSSSSSPDSFIVVGDVLYMRASTQVLPQHDLVRFDAATNTAQNAGGMVSVGNSSITNALHKMNGELYFFASSDELGMELFRYNPETKALTNPNQEIVVGTNAFSYSTTMAELNGELIFAAGSADIGGSKLFAYNPTTNDIREYLALPDNGSLNAASGLVASNGKIYFNGTIDPANTGWYQAVYDPATDSLAKVNDVYGGVDFTSQFEESLSFNGALYFRAFSSTYGWELFRINHTTNAIELVADIYAGGSSSHARFFVEGTDGNLYFSAYNGTNNWQLFQYNPNTESTVAVTPNTNFQVASYIAPVSDGILMHASTAETGYEFYKYEFASESVTLVADLSPGALTTSYGMMTATDTQAYIYAYVRSSNNSWQEDIYSYSFETGEITQRTSAEDGDYIGYHSTSIAVGETYFFIANLPEFGREVYYLNLNDAPVITGTPNTSVLQGNTYSFTPTVTDTENDLLTFSITNKPLWASFSTTTGELSGTPQQAHVGITENIVITVADADNQVSLPAFNLEVVNVNDAPTISGSPATSVLQDALYSFTPTANDIDGDSLTYAVLNAPAWTSFDTNTGTLSGTPSNAEVGVYSNIQISVSDGGLSDTLTAFSITVENVNDAPTINGAPSTSVDQGSLYSFTPVAVDIDGDSLSFSITNKPAWVSFNTLTGALTGTPGNSDVGVHSNIQISVNDGQLGSALAAFSITVVNVNDAPTISGSPVTSVNEDTAYSFTPSASDVDVGDSLIFSIANKPVWATFNPTTGTLAGVPTNDHVGTASGVTISVSDGTLSASLAPFSITVVNVNDAPTISGTPPTSVNEDSVYSFTPAVADVDSTSFTYSISGMPAWASFSAATGTLTGTPTNDHVGTSSAITISVSDGELSASLPSFTITVVNVNDAPTISGSPATTVAQDAAYSFTPSVNDIDSTSFTYSIVNKPVWASFSTSTGTLSGTPTQDHLGSTAGITITVSDGELSASLPAFSIEVTNVNDAPVISGTPATTVAQDATYSFTPTASDVDGDSLSFSITGAPTWASFNGSTGALTGTPTNDDVGIHSNIVITVSDGTLTADLPTFAIEVTNVNDAPTITGTPAAFAEVDEAYSFTPTVEDIDNDVLTFGAENLPTWLTIDTATGTLSGAPTMEDIAVWVDISLSVNDGTVSASLPVFTIEVTYSQEPPVANDDTFSLPRNNDGVYLLDVLANDTDINEDSLTLVEASASVGSVSIVSNQVQLTIDAQYTGKVSVNYSVDDGMGGRDSARAEVTITGSGAINLVVPDDLVVPATGALTRVDLGEASAADANGQPLSVSLVEQRAPVFAPGVHEVMWQATNADGERTVLGQRIEVVPMVSLARDVTTAAGISVNLPVMLNGLAPSYPFVIDYTVDGVASLLELEQGTQGAIRVTAPTAGDTIVVALADSMNLGEVAEVSVTSSAANMAPQVSVAYSQDGQKRTTVLRSGGLIELVATATDANAGDTLSYNWQSPVAGGATDGGTRYVIDPLLIAANTAATVRVTVTDAAGLRGYASVILNAVDAHPTLGSDTDADGDGLPDMHDGTNDDLGQGIPNYLNPSRSCQLIAARSAQAGNIHFAQGSMSACLRLGELGMRQFNTHISVSEGLDADTNHTRMGSAFDFEIFDLSEPGGTSRIVLPLSQPIPTNALYRKHIGGAWQDFVQDENNQIFSAAGEPGVCPALGSSQWQAGLTAGHWCVQLQLEDGGANDADGMANGVIVDPGALSVAATDNTTPEATADSVTVIWQGDAEIDVLANDIDADDDSLVITSAHADIGTVTVINDGAALHYDAPANYAGTATVTYAIDDGRGGVATAAVAVMILANRAPETTVDTVSTVVNKPVSVDVVANDIDADGDTLTVASAEITSGTGGAVAFEGGTVTVTPATGVTGAITVVYVVTDNRGATASGILRVQVNVPHEPAAPQSSSGQMTWWLLLMGLMGAALRRSVNLRRNNR